MLATALGTEESRAVVVPEDEARAACYGLIAHIFSSPPSETILRTIATVDLVHGAIDGPLYSAWRQLQESAAQSNAARLSLEFDDLFGGVGKPRIALHGCYYLTGFFMEKPLAKLRDDLAQLGLSRRSSVGEPEDHISALCEAMRVLVAGLDGNPPAPIETQRDFFRRHLAPWVDALAAVLQQNEVSAFYASVGRFMHEFFQIENESFEIV
jgi:TorA maturation chaperone TorD